MPIPTLETAKNALLANRAAISVTAQNVANANTPGYVRQRVRFVPVVGNVRAGGETGGIGSGVEVAAVERLQDDFIATQLNAQTGRKGHDQVISDALAQVEDIFTDTTTGGVGQAIGDMFSAFGRLGANPTVTTSRDEVLERCSIVADSIRRRYADVQSLREENDASLSADVREVNDLAQRIAELNAKITSSDTTSAANNLMDLRDQAMTRLAELTGAIAIPETGNTIDVAIGGQRIVQFDRTKPLTVVPDPAQPGMHRVAFASGEDVPGMSGEIAGRIEARDDYLVGYETKLDALAAALADAVNAQQKLGYDIYDNLGLAIFEYDAAGPAATLKINATVAADSGLLAASSKQGAAGDGQNASAIYDLANSKLFGGGTQTLEEYNADTIARIGRDAQHALTTAETSTQLVTSLTDRYQTQAGVSLDEEAIELSKYQQAYQAAARVLQMSLELMDAILAIGR